MRSSGHEHSLIPPKETQRHIIKFCLNSGQGRFGSLTRTLTHSTRLQMKGLVQRKTRLPSRNVEMCVARSLALEPFDSECAKKLSWNIGRYFNYFDILQQLVRHSMFCILSAAVHYICVVTVTTDRGSLQAESSE